MFRMIHSKRPVHESLFNKVAALSPAMLWKSDPAQLFSCEFYNLKTHSVVHLPMATTINCDKYYIELPLKLIKKHLGN